MLPRDMAGPPELILLFVSCEKLKDRWSRIDQTCQRLGVSSYFIVSGGHKKTAFDESNKRLLLDCEDTYEALPSKVLMMLRETHLRYPDAALWKIDDDVELMIDRHSVQGLTHQILTLAHDRANSFIAPTTVKRPASSPRAADWAVGRCSTDSHWNTTPYLGECASECANGGHTYIIGPDALNLLTKTRENPKLHVLEDLMVSLIIEHESKNEIKVKELRSLKSLIATDIYDKGVHHN